MEVGQRVALKGRNKIRGVVQQILPKGNFCIGVHWDRAQGKGLAYYSEDELINEPSPTVPPVVLDALDVVQGDLDRWKKGDFS